jgi:hypothetical protein
MLKYQAEAAVAHESAAAEIECLLDMKAETVED